MKHRYKPLVALLATVLLAVPLASCRGVPSAQSAAPEPVELTVFAAASMQESLNAAAELYRETNPGVTVTCNFDSSGTLKTQIAEGAVCDIFISAGQKQMNQLDGAADASVNTDGLDFILSDTRFDLVTNTVVLIVPEGNPAGITSFEDVNTDRVSLIALGNSDVPAGQYAQQIFVFLGMWDALNRDGKITFSSNVKEVAAQVAAAAVDCGVVYVSDAAATDAVEVAAQAPQGSHKPVNYPAAVLKASEHPEEAEAFLEFLKSDVCAEIFTGIGFGIPS